MSKSLNEFVKDNSKFLKIDDGETFEGNYLGYKVATSQYDPDKEVVIYQLEFPDGKKVFWQTGSTAVARVISNFKGGEKIKITRHGTGTGTKYDISSPDVVISKDELTPDEEIPF